MVLSLLLYTWLSFWHTVMLAYFYTNLQCTTNSMHACYDQPTCMLVYVLVCRLKLYNDQHFPTIQALCLLLLVFVVCVVVANDFTCFAKLVSWSFLPSVHTTESLPVLSQPIVTALQELPEGNLGEGRNIVLIDLQLYAFCVVGLKCSIGKCMNCTSVSYDLLLQLCSVHVRLHILVIIDVL